MDRTKTTIPKVFIIESLYADDVPENRVVGEIIHKVLCMGNLDSKYRYVNTIQELSAALDEFAESEFRYLHISCHGTDQYFVFQFGELPFGQFHYLVRDMLRGKRVFVSACQVVNHENHELANLILRDTGCQSLVGSFEDINFNDAVLLWSSFYYLCFRNQMSPIKLRRNDILYNLRRLTSLYRINLNYYSKHRDEGIQLTQINQGKLKRL